MYCQSTVTFKSSATKITEEVATVIKANLNKDILVTFYFEVYKLQQTHSIHIPFF